MKRLWLGIGVLAALLGAAVGLCGFSQGVYERTVPPVQQAAALAMAEEWEAADALTGEARAQWERYRAVLAAFTDHEPVEDMERLFRQLEIYSASREASDYAAVCVELSQLGQSIREYHSVQWWTVL